MEKLACLMMVVSSLVGMHCSDPVLISDPCENGSKPSVAVNSQGDAAVAWIGMERFKEGIRCAQRKFQEEWSYPELATESFEEMQAPRCFLSDLGDAYILWQNLVRGTAEWAHKSAYSQWTDPVHLYLDSSCNHKSVFDRNGRFFFVNSKYSAGGLFSRRSHQLRLNLMQRNASEPHSFSPADGEYSWLNGQDTDAEAMGMNRSGDLFVVWKKRFSEDPLQGSWLLPYGSFTEVEDIGPPVGLTEYRLSGMVIDHQKNVVLVGVRDKRVQALCRFDEQWSNWVPLSQEANFKGTLRMPLPLVAIDQSGNIMVVWKTEKENEVWIESSYRPRGGEWMALKEIVLDGKVESVLLRSDHYDHFIVVWDEKKDRKLSSIYGVEMSNESGKWSEIVQLSPPNEYCLEPTLEFSNNGTGVLAWTKRSSTFDSCIEAVDICLGE